MPKPIHPEKIAALILWIRDEKVLLDHDLARLYGVETRTLKQAVRRNRSRFPADFMIELSKEEASAIQRSRSQSVILKRGENVKYRPMAFTEQGVAMLSSILRSERAAEVNIAIMRTFVQLRRLMDSNLDLARRIESLERKYDEQFSAVFKAIKSLIADDEIRTQPQREIGFHVDLGEPTISRPRKKPKGKP